jgi:hypothetical protein
MPTTHSRLACRAVCCTTVSRAYLPAKGLLQQQTANGEPILTNAALHCRATTDYRESAVRPTAAQACDAVSVPTYNGTSAGSVRIAYEELS